MEIELSCGSCHSRCAATKQEITLIVHLRNNRKKIMARIACVIFVAVAFLAFARVTEVFEQPIETATVQEIQNLNGFGPVLSENVYDYVHSSYWKGDLEDLKNILGIGPDRFKELERHFK